MGSGMDSDTRAAYTVIEEPLGTSKPIRIICIGAGISGINLLRTLRLNLTNFEVIVYEKNHDVGGTWLENRYPGCRCDIPSHNYQFSWRPNKRWSNFFSPAEEIAAYVREVCDEEGMMESIRLEHKVVDAQWNESDGLWHLKIEDTTSGRIIEDYAHFLVNASGVLNRWKWPDVPGLESFEGDLVHTAAWPDNFQHAGKVVAVIGNGSSGLQVFPAIQPSVQKLYHVVRTPTWVTPPWRMLQSMLGRGKAFENIAVDDKEEFTHSQIEQFEQNPAMYRAFVQGIERLTASNFPTTLKDGPAQALAAAKAKEYMTQMLGGDEKLCKALIPQFPVGMRRITPAPGYLEALGQPNVEVLTSGLRLVTSDAIELESGEVVKVDAIICATGFDTSFRSPFPILGRSGNLQDKWQDGIPKAYMSCAIVDVPNYFTFHGPNGPYGHGSLFTASEHVAKYIVRGIKKCQTQGIKAIAPTQSATDDYNEHIQAFMPRTTWASKGKSWFKGGKEEGPVTALHPGSRTHFFHMLDDFRAEDFEYVYHAPSGNRFAYLGDGFSTRELNEDEDSLWYLEGSGKI